MSNPVLIPSGALAPGFSGDGLVSTPVGAGVSHARSIAIQTDGKYVVAGWTDAGGGDQDFVVLRYNADGRLDTTFSGNGIQTAAFTGDDTAAGVAIQADGRIVVAGTANFGSAKLGALQLQPGMQGTVMVKTGERSLLVYLARPLLRRFSTAMSER